MGQYDQQHKASVAYSMTPPPAAETYSGAYVMAPPPMGYPTKDAHHQDSVPADTTTTRGGGFFKGCLAGLCCCWCLDCCF